MFFNNNKNKIESIFFDKKSNFNIDKGAEINLVKVDEEIKDRGLIAGVKAMTIKNNAFFLLIKISENSTLVEQYCLLNYNDNLGDATITHTNSDAIKLKNIVFIENSSDLGDKIVYKFSAEE